MLDTKLLKLRVSSSVVFAYFCHPFICYECVYDKYKFIVPIEDTLNSQGSNPMFESPMKGIFMMRWIRKQMEAETELDKITSDEVNE